MRLRLPNYMAKRADLCAHFTTAVTRGRRGTNGPTMTMMTNDGRQATTSPRRRCRGDNEQLRVAARVELYGLNCVRLSSLGTITVLQTTVGVCELCTPVP